MIIIPDIHGRTFWQQAITGCEDEKIILLGDYTDPYPMEGIPTSEGLQSLQQVIELKKEHPDQVVLLLGNHDLSYLSPYLPRCRHDNENHEAIAALLQDNLECFDIAHEERVGNRRVVFSHAGILPGWMAENEETIGEPNPGEEVGVINRLFHQGVLYPALGNVSGYRGGEYPVGSCVWADIEEYMDYLPDVLPECYQVFGHSLLRQPLITDRFACLDCRTAFRMDEDLSLTKID